MYVRRAYFLVGNFTIKFSNLVDIIFQGGSLIKSESYIIYDTFYKLQKVQLNETVEKFFAAYQRCNV